MSPHKRPSKKAAPVKEVPPAAHEYRSGLTLLHPHSAGIDVHSDMHMVCVPAESVSWGVANAGGGLPPNVRRFGANSCDLKAIAEWLRACGVTTVAMESTGVYWIPLFELLESFGFTVCLVEPRQLSRCDAALVPGVGR